MIYCENLSGCWFLGSSFDTDTVYGIHISTRCRRVYFEHLQGKTQREHLRLHMVSQVKDLIWVAIFESAYQTSCGFERKRLQGG